MLTNGQRPTGEASMTRHRYYAKEWLPGKWRVIDRENFSLPIYGQDDKPLDFDEDTALEAVDNLNSPPVHQ